MFKRVAFFMYGSVAYALFLLTFLYAIAFVGGFWVPTRLDGAAQGSLATSFAIDAGLLAVFAIQHSVMARRWFKTWLTTFVPQPIERSTYVLCASAALMLLFWQWRPLGGTVWNVENPVARVALFALSALGWKLVLVVTFLINHFDLFGLRQVWYALLDKPRPAVSFTTPGPYRLVRHPLYFGFMLAFWMTPTMTFAHLVFAMATTAYIVLAIQFEEADLVAEHGRAYESYRRRVPMLLPGVRGNKKTQAVVTASALMLALSASPANAQSAPGRDVPEVPTTLAVPDGYTLFFKGHAIGTQNYVCLPTATGVAWKFIAPQATLFADGNGDIHHQLTTHFLSANATENGLARPTWQHSQDSSRVWAKLKADPVSVDPTAIPWLLLERVGVAQGPDGGQILTRTALIQRLNTTGGLAPATGCTQPSDVGRLVLVPYTADYFFYRDPGEGSDPSPLS